MNRSQVMKLTYVIKAERGCLCTLSEAMHLAWLCAKGFSDCFNLSLSTGHVYGGAHSFEQARANRIAASTAATRSGVKVYGSQEFNLSRYVWMASNAPAKPVKAVRAKSVRPARPVFDTEISTHISAA